MTFTCPFSSSQVIWKLSRSVRGHFVFLTETSIHLFITDNSGHICRFLLNAWCLKL